MSAEDYLAWEREQDVKHEFFHGEVFAMSGGSTRHNALAVALGGELRAALKSRGCVVLSSDQRLAFPPNERYVYPDVTVVCGPREYQAGTTDVLTNPSVLVEVLSTSTEEYDRGLKWAGYQRIASLTDYVLVSQAEIRVEHFRRDGQRWIYRTLGAGERLVVATGIEVSIDSIYDGTLELEAD
jgi:Uma2 family endonuclease